MSNKITAPVQLESLSFEELSDEESSTIAGGGNLGPVAGGVLGSLLLNNDDRSFNKGGVLGVIGNTINIS